MNWPPSGPVSPRHFVMLTGACPSCRKPLRYQHVTTKEFEAKEFEMFGCRVRQEAGKRDQHACGIFLPEDWREMLRLFAALPEAMRLTL